MSESPIASGRYSPDLSVNLTVWNDGENPPEGYDVIRNDDGSSLAVVKDRGDVKRDVNGNAYALPEGGALAEFPDGSVVTLAGSELDDFLARYKPEGSSSVASTSSDSAGAAADAAAANPTTTTQQGVTEPNPVNPVEPNPANPVEPNPANPVEPNPGA